MGRDKNLGWLLQHSEVSIHAPAWGATKLGNVSKSEKNVVSIHAPAWGATTDNVAVFREGFSFNPRARMGRDQ